MNKRVIGIIAMVAWIMLGTKDAWYAILHPDHSIKKVHAQLGGRDTVDEGLILQGLDDKKTFASTFDWYKQKWCGGVTFYRPLTSQGFWLWKKVFGDKRLDLWLRQSLIFHVIAVILSFFVLEELFGTWIAIAGIMLFAGPPIPVPFPGEEAGRIVMGRAWSFGGEHFSFTLPFWKNAPEYWVTIPLMVGILMFLRERYIGAHFCMLIAMFVKETGFAVLPAFALVAYLTRKKAPSWFWLEGIILTLMTFLFRYLALGSMGYSLGSNNSWWYRAILYFGGQIAGGIVTGGYFTLLIGFLTGTAMMLLILRVKNRLFQTFGMIVIIAVWSYFILVEWNWGIIAIAVAMVLIPCALRYYPRECIFCFGWMIVFSAGLYTAAQVTKHAWYVADIMRTTMFVLSVIGLVRFIHDHKDPLLVRGVIGVKSYLAIPHAQTRLGIVNPSGGTLARPLAAPVAQVRASLFSQREQAFHDLRALFGHLYRLSEIVADVKECGFTGRNLSSEVCALLLQRKVELPLSRAHRLQLVHEVVEEPRRIIPGPRG